jgi:transcription termination factor Rho
MVKTPTQNNDIVDYNDLVGGNQINSSNNNVNSTASYQTSRRTPNNYAPRNQNPDSDMDSNEKTYKVSGILEIKQEYGILRQDKGEDNMPKDVYIAQTQIHKFGLRKADHIEGQARAPKPGERYLSLLKVEKVDGMDPAAAKARPRFEMLTPIFPNQRVKLETTQEILTTRIIDLMAPVGKGQRGMIVAPPKAGKTWLLKDVARGIYENHPEMKIIVVLIGERPEEVTDMQRNVQGEVWASNFDEAPADQVTIAENALERAKRLAEIGGDVVILMDSLTRLARAYNMVEAPSGRTLTGGLDPVALYPPKKFFGAARKFEEGGSLTIIATALVDTGSRMDDVIFEEFKGTGNMELFLNRTLAERRIYPSIDIRRSMTRHEELLQTKKESEKVITLRRMIDLLDENEATQIVIEKMKKTKTNDLFLDSLSSSNK